MKAMTWGACVLVLSACGSGNGAPAEAAPQLRAPPAPKTHLLSIVGYNYTDRYIDHFEVNGRGGGNLDISTPTAGGGSQACCVSWTEGSPLPLKVKVKWVAAYCMQHDVTSQGEHFEMRQPLLKVTEVAFNGPVPANPTNFEVHFYPDGHVEAAISDEYSPPRLILPAPPNGYARPWVKVNDPPCPVGYDRAYSFNHPTPVPNAPSSPSKP